MANRDIGIRMALILKLAVLLAVASVHTARAQGPPPVCFWSSSGPVPVDRGGELAARGQDGEGLLEVLLQGPTAEERARGVWTAIPLGTTLERVLIRDDGTVIVRLAVPLGELLDLDHDSFEVIVRQIGWTLDSLDWRELRIEVWDPIVEDYVPLAGFLPPISIDFKDVGPSDIEIPETSVTYVGQPSAYGQDQPHGGLSGRTVYVSPGHGWEWRYDYRVGYSRWATQRIVYEDFIEDHNNGEAVNQYLLQYLWNAGASVWPARERDVNDVDVIVNNDDPTGYSEEGLWYLSANPGYDLNVPGTYHYAVVSPTATATATWTTVIPTDMQSAVYVWYRSASDRAPDARYTVHHAAGETSVAVDQRHHGFTWHYIGTYGFRAGEVATVTLSNQSVYSGLLVIADAVRFGGGTFDSLSGIDTAALYPPDKPWWETAAFYYTQMMGMSQPPGDVTARPIYARWEHANTGDDAVYVSWHTNGWNGTTRGTETYAHNGDWLPRTDGSLDLRDAIHDELVHDIRAGWDPSWTDRGTKLSNLGELRELWDENEATRMPGALVEIAFHDNPQDADALREPSFQMLAARAIYQGIVRYFAERDSEEPKFLPEPPTHAAVRNVGAGQVLVSWRPSPTDTVGLVGDPATGYRVYTSSDGLGWSQGVSVTSGTAYTITGLAEGELLFVRVSGTNAGGESFPSETLAVRVETGDHDAGTLLVNGFDRLNQTMMVEDYDPVEGYNLRMFLDRMNSYDYVIQHGEAISLPFDSASNEAVGGGQVSLDDYGLVDWILGEESTQDETLNGTEQALLESYLSGGGGLFISGAEIGWDLDYLGSSYDRAFYNDVLRADYDSDDAETYAVTPTVGAIFEGLADFRFDAVGMYAAEYPDVMSPHNGSVAALTYAGGLGGTAAVQYSAGTGACPRLVHFGFPFETVVEAHREPVMARILQFMAPCLPQTPSTLITEPEHLSAHRTSPPFAGTASAAAVDIQRVNVQVERQLTESLYWTGAGWSTDPAWLTATGTTAWSYVLPPPPSLADGDYRLRARAWTTEGVSDTSPAEVVFTYDTVPPGNTSLITPTGGVTITAVWTDLEWEEVSAGGGSAIGYVVKLDDQPYTTTQTTYSTSPMSEGTHTWSVQVYDAAGNRSSWVTETFAVVYLERFLPLVLRGYDGDVEACTDVIVDGGFEAGGAWTFNALAVYDASMSHTGSRSARVGILPGEPGSTAYSSVAQTLELPSVGSGTLRLWVYPFDEVVDADDWHYAGIRDGHGVYHSLDSWASNGQVWEQREYDVGAYLGQTVTLYIGTYNDGDEDTAAMYIDDVSLEVCP